MTASRWRAHAATLVAVAAVTVLVALPAPRTHAPTAAAGSGPLTLAQAWPKARVLDLPSTLPDGGRFAPMLVLDAGHVIGEQDSTDGGRSGLVVLPIGDAARGRVLQAFSGADNVSINALTVADGRLYWLSGQPGEAGHVRTRLYSTELAGAGAPRVLTEDTGQPTYYGSQYDLQVVDGRVYWSGTRDTTPVTSELRSVPVDGGPVTVRPLDRMYSPIKWPWLSSWSGRPDEPLALLDVDNGQLRTVSATPGVQLACDPVWCRSIESGGSHPVVALWHPDGTGRLRINADDENSVTVDVAMLDRFELLAAPLANQQPSASDRLALYDLRTRRRVQLGVVTAEGMYGRWVWWATGDNETLTWHLLDLGAL